MTLFWIFAALALLLALIFTISPLRSAPQPFPADPLPEELQAEIDALKEEARSLEGSERKRTLGRIVHLEKRLAELQGAPAPKKAGRPWLSLTLAAIVLLVSTGVLLRYVVPRAPGGTITTTSQINGAQPADGEAATSEKLAALKKKAEQKNDLDSWLAYADEAWKEADYNAAAEGYKKVLEIDDKNLKAWKRMGILFYMSGYPEDAANVLAVVVTFDPKDTEALLFLGQAYSSLGRFEEAIGAWKRYIQAGGPQKEYVESMIKTAEERLAQMPPEAQQQSALPPDHPPVGDSQAAADVPPDHPQAPAGMEDVIDGKIVYREKCAACHGQNGEGGIGPALAHNPVLKVDGAVEEIVQRGTGTMPAVEMSDKELKALIEYMQQEM
ncbi:c-type cytochrome [Oceanithermus sp.]